MKHHQTPGSDSKEYLTPPDILEKMEEFDLDPCAPIKRPWPIAKQHYTINDDGLSLDWQGRVWCNPPFDKFTRPKFMARMAEHGNGVMMIPAAFETRPFREYVWDKADAILFLSYRPHYYNNKGERLKFNSGGPMVLVAYGFFNVRVLEQSDLGPVFKSPWGK